MASVEVRSALVSDAEAGCAAFFLVFSVVFLAPFLAEADGLAAAETVFGLAFVLFDATVSFDAAVSVGFANFAIICNRVFALGTAFPELYASSISPKTSAAVSADSTVAALWARFSPANASSNS